jgi:MFS family permease
MDQPPISAFPPRRPSHVRYGVLVLVALAAGSAYLTRHCLAVANTTIQRELHWDNTQMGWVFSWFSFGYLICQVPGGWLGNRIGTRLALASLSVLWSVLTLWTAAVSSLVPMIASRFAFGMAQAGLVPISMQIVKDWIPFDRRGISSAIITASMSIGGALTMHYTAELMEQFHWRDVFRMYSLVGIVWALIFYVYFRNWPEQHPWANQAERDLICGRLAAADSGSQGASESRAEALRPGGMLPEETDSARISPLVLAGSFSLWALCAQMFFKAAGYNLFVTFFPAFLEFAYGATPTSAGAMTKWPLLGVIAGGLVGGLLVDRVLRRTGNKWISRSGVASCTLAMTAVTVSAATRTSSSGHFVAIVALGAALSGMSHASMWAAAIDMGGRHTAVIAGIMNMAGCVSGVVVTPLVGRLMDGIRHTAGNWNIVIYVHAAFYLAGAIAWLYVNPNKALVKQSQHL